MIGLNLITEMKIKHQPSSLLTDSAIAGHQEAPNVNYVGYNTILLRLRLCIKVLRSIKALLRASQTPVHVQQYLG